ncbi:MAG: molybdenum cofactor guanylyltransferase [Candidatus Bathyarchaeota archaeon]|nr:molybdenum cofactor guanylyltransferase [Candidatus Bathyarchaeota archaeon]
MTKRAAIILAGGRGQRFQTAEGKWQDKALAMLDGKPLIVHAIENVQSVVDEVIVVVNDNEGRKSVYNDAMQRYGINDARIVTDLKINRLSGPLIAILTGLKSANADYCLTVPCDVPLLSEKVADYMFNEIDGSYVAVPVWPNGRLETLLMVLDRVKALEVTDVLAQLGRSHPDDIIRGLLHALFVSPLGQIKVLDPELKSFVNINSQEDLARLQPRQAQGPVVENIRLNLGTLPSGALTLLVEVSERYNSTDYLKASEVFAQCASTFEREHLFFWAALSREHQAKTLLNMTIPQLTRQIKDAFQKAAQNYSAEAAQYMENGCYLLAKRATADKAWCLSQIKQ